MMAIRFTTGFLIPLTGGAEMETLRWRSRNSSLESSQDPFCPAFLRAVRKHEMFLEVHREQGELPSQPRLL